MELCNAYTELNDPVLQREAFAKQVIAGENSLSPTISF
jgi:lysyl-tRNA synthetase class II